MKVNDRVRENKKRPTEQFVQDPNKQPGMMMLLNPEGWVFGTINRGVDSEPCSACGQPLSAPESRWRVHWDDGRETEQFENTLVAVAAE